MFRGSASANTFRAKLSVADVTAWAELSVAGVTAWADGPSEGSRRRKGAGELQHLTAFGKVVPTVVLPHFGAPSGRA